MNNQKFFSVVQVIGAFALWSTLGVFFQKVRLPVSVSVVYGSSVGLIALYAYFYLKERCLPSLRFSWPLAAVFLVAAVKGVIWFRALTLLPIAHAMLIHNLAPVVAAVFSWFFLKEKPSMSHGVAILTGFVGLALLLQALTVPALSIGVMFALGTAIASGIQDVAQRKLSPTVAGASQAFVFILGQATGNVIFLLPSLTQALTWPDAGAILYFGIAGTAVPIILLSRAFARLKAFEVATLGYTEPVLGALWGALFLGQPILPTTAIGGFLIFLSGLTAVRNEKLS